MTTMLSLRLPVESVDLVQPVGPSGAGPATLAVPAVDALEEIVAALRQGFVDLALTRRKLSVGVPIDLWLALSQAVIEVGGAPFSAMELLARHMPELTFEVEAADRRAAELAHEVLAMRRALGEAATARAADQRQLAELRRAAVADAERLALLDAVEAAAEYEPQEGPVDEIARRVEAQLAVEDRARDALLRRFTGADLRRLHDLVAGALRWIGESPDGPDDGSAAAFIDAVINEPRGD